MGVTFTVVNSDRVQTIQNVNFTQYRFIYIPTCSGQTDGGITDLQNNLLMGRRNDIKNYINNLGGSLIALTQSRLSNPYGFFPMPLEFANNAKDFIDVTVTGESCARCAVCAVHLQGSGRT